MVHNEEEFPRRCEQKDRIVKEAWEGWGPAKGRCDLARGLIGAFRRSKFKEPHFAIVFLSMGIGIVVWHDIQLDALQDL